MIIFVPAQLVIKTLAARNRRRLKIERRIRKRDPSRGSVNFTHTWSRALYLRGPHRSRRNSRARSLSRPRRPRGGRIRNIENIRADSLPRIYDIARGVERETFVEALLSRLTCVFRPKSL